jgi:sterol 3beta-glucosyltransferase
LVLEAVRLSGQRAILATGWGGLSAQNAPPGVYVLNAAPHDWLLPQVSAVVHHGGAGTTAAALRAGKPAVICPFVADQPFWGRRVVALGAGPSPLPQRKMTAEKLAAAIHAAVTDPLMRQNAAALGRTIRAENGVETAVTWINRQLLQA